METEIDCEFCIGSGERKGEICNHCGGSGRKEEESVEDRIEAARNDAIESCAKIVEESFHIAGPFKFPERCEQIAVKLRAMKLAQGAK